MTRRAYLFAALLCTLAWCGRDGARHSEPQAYTYHTGFLPKP